MPRSGLRAKIGCTLLNGIVSNALASGTSPRPSSLIRRNHTNGRAEYSAPMDNRSKLPSGHRRSFLAKKAQNCQLPIQLFPPYRRQSPSAVLMGDPFPFMLLDSHINLAQIREYESLSNMDCHCVRSFPRSLVSNKEEPAKARLGDHTRWCLRGFRNGQGNIVQSP